MNLIKGLSNVNESLNKKMKISVSNIAWYQDPKDFQIFRFIKNLNCDGVEIAPSAIWDELFQAQKIREIFLRRV